MIRFFFLLLLSYGFLSCGSSDTKHFSSSTNLIGEPGLKILARELYPSDFFAQEIFIGLIKIMNLHKTKDPFLGGKAPGFSGFGMDRLPLGFYFNTTEDTTSLLLVNLVNEHSNDIETRDDWAKTIGFPLSIFRDIPLEAIATQQKGEKLELKSFFSYLVGADISIYDIEGNENYPHAKYLARSHPLRKAIGKKMAPLVAPMKSWQIDFSLLPDLLKLHGSLQNKIISLIVHESFHIHDSNERIGNSFDLNLGVEPNEIIQASKNTRFKKLIYGYFYAISSIMKASKNSDNDLINNKVLRKELALLKELIKALKAEFPHAYQAYIFEEYSEGFAEYSAAQTMVDASLRSYEEQIKIEVQDEENSIFYRTGALGGMFMRTTVKTLPWSASEGKGYDKQSVWEKLLDALLSDQTGPSKKEINQFLDSLDKKAIELELSRIPEYYED